VPFAACQLVQRIKSFDFLRENSYNTSKVSSKNPVPAKVVCLFDVDNTLLDNDHVISDLHRYLEREVGLRRAQHYWDIFELLRAAQDYADYLGALQRYRREYPHELNLLTVSRFLINDPFANRLFPNSLDAVEQAKKWGTVALLTDGDVVFQPHKVDRSGLCEAVEGKVLIYVHKEKELADVERRCPASHYVMVDDKLRILSAMKASWGPRLTTVFVRQGHYALDPALVAKYPAADITLERIGDFVGCDLHRLLTRARAKSARMGAKTAPPADELAGKSLLGRGRDGAHLPARQAGGGLPRS